MSEDNRGLLLLTAELAKAYVSGNSISPDALPSLINELHQTLVNLGGSH